MHFSKYHGAGNDFILVEGDATTVSSADAQRLCDRHFGIGADGILLIGPPQTEGSLASMRVVNSDGSVPEMCGNGLRCVALYLAHHRAVTDFVVDTGAGALRCQVALDGEHGGQVTIDMGVATVDAASVTSAGRVTLEVGAHGPLEFVGVSTGNPHAVVFGPWENTKEAAAQHGAALSCHRAFPQGANVGFARVVGHKTLELTVFERGAGLTLACGTGACAAASAAVALGKVESGEEVPVSLPGGLLHISVSSLSANTYNTVMRGPAQRVFVGEALPSL